MCAVIALFAWGAAAIAIHMQIFVFGELAHNPDFANESCIINATMDAPYGTVVKVMDVLRKHGFWRIYLFTM